MASGDPYEDSVILWTRAYPTDPARVDVPVCVKYAVYTDKSASGKAVSSGFAYTSYDVDFTVKVEAKGLSASTVYYYQFQNCAGSEKSPVGRTRTAPPKDGKVDSVCLTLIVLPNFLTSPNS